MVVVKPIIHLLLSLFLFAAPAMADDEPPIALTVDVDQSMVPPGATFTLTVNVTGRGFTAGLPEPNLPRLKRFSIVGTTSATEVSVVNFAMTMTRRHVYRIEVPDDTPEGSYRIPVVTLTHDGRTYRAGPVDITVDKNAPPPHGPQAARRRFPGFDPDVFPQLNRAGDADDLKVEMTVDKERVVPYEYLTATFTFLRAVQLWDKPGFDRPDFKGFWVEALPFGPAEEERFTKRIDGRLYAGTSVRYALVPLSAGERIVDAARLTVSPDPWSGRKTLATEPIPIVVADFPAEGKPAAFNGMVGTYTVTAAVEPKRTPVNGGATLKLTIVGEGYLKPAPAPGRPVVDGFEVFEPKVDDRLEKQNGKLISTRIVEIPMIARTQGEWIVPPVELAWFDPSQGTYVTAATDPAPITVLPGAAAAPSAAPAAGGGDVDIRYIKPDRIALDDRARPIYRRGWYPAVAALAIPLLAAGYVVGRRRKRIATDSRFARTTFAAETARRRLAAPPSAQTVDEALRGYLADKTGASAPAVDEAWIRATIGPVDAELADAAIGLIEAVRVSRYAPSGPVDAVELARRAETVVAMGEKRLK
jgi:hypothetical protein